MYCETSTPPRRSKNIVIINCTKDELRLLCRCVHQVLGDCDLGNDQPAVENLWNDLSRIKMEMIR